ncbi:hypothetical protein Bca52824_031643 [Brassica carinata]|uniref:Uncharacterized protein n=1 Tax=Brassica carinata TaxID=52824 RepID=A0A8X7SB22_BRACI|nr:hypothetical protein Bca52824_031643 [Brassica carinata]
MPSFVGFYSISVQSDSASSFPAQSDTTSYMHYGNASFAPQDQLVSNTHESQGMMNGNGGGRLGLGPPSGFQNNHLVQPHSEMNPLMIGQTQETEEVMGFIRGRDKG